MTLPYFGELDLTSLNDYYTVNTEFDGHQIQLALSFNNKTIDSSHMELVKAFIEKMEKFDKQNKIEIDKDFNSGDYVQYFMENVLEGFELVQPTHPITDPVELLFNSMHLVKLGLFPDHEHTFAIFHYVISTGLEGVSDYMVVIYTDKEGEIAFMSTES
jgi:hypothetical protein